MNLMNTQIPSKYFIFLPSHGHNKSLAHKNIIWTVWDSFPRSRPCPPQSLPGYTFCDDSRNKQWFPLALTVKVRLETRNNKCWRGCTERGTILQEDIIFNVYVPNNKVSKYVRQKLIELQRQIDKSTILEGIILPDNNNNGR